MTRDPNTVRKETAPVSGTRVLQFRAEEYGGHEAGDAGADHRSGTSRDIRTPFRFGRDLDIRVSEVGQIGARVFVISTVSVEGEVFDGVGSCESTAREAVLEAESRSLDDAVSKFRRFSEDARAAHELSSHIPASCLGDLISSAQLRIARGLERTAGIDADREAGKLFGLRLGELSRKAAEQMIEHLEALAYPKSERLNQAVG